MQRFDLIAPCHFGLESVLKKEIIKLGYERREVADGRVTFAGDPDAVPVNLAYEVAKEIKKALEADVIALGA